MTLSASRREFLRHASALSALGPAAPWALNLAAIGEAAAQGSADYKAVVCVYLGGGNDHSNTVIPYDSAGHANYTLLRDTLGIPRDALANTVLNPLNPQSGVQLALAPELAPLIPIFNAGRLGVLLNIGTLIQPTTQAEFLARSVRLPPKLGSHNDQTSVWQSFAPEGAVSGWGGRMGDLFASSNGDSTFTSISVASNTVFLSGGTTAQYQISPAGATAVKGISTPLFGSSAASAALHSLITNGAHSNLHRVDHARMMNRSIQAEYSLRNLLEDLNLTTEFPATSLGQQLNMVAKMMAIRTAIGARRQVFFVSLGGFDLHDFLATSHPPLLKTIADSLSAFDAALTELNLQNSVTTFTASEFGRTLTSNGDGSDHGWGAHHFVMGGAVQGQRLIGTFPVLATSGPDNASPRGNLIPTTSVDQLAATLATWFGVPASDLPFVVPNINNYSLRNLGFLNPNA